MIKKSIYKNYYSSPIGPLCIEIFDEKLKAIFFVSEMHTEVVFTPLFIKVCQQLDEYFGGIRKTFEIPMIDFRGTLFQRKVWKTLMEIPYGKVWSYQRMAMAIQHPLAVRAVGQAIHKNPMAIIVPCHRVIGKSGHLAGYASGIHRKEFLLRLEKAL